MKDMTRKYGASRNRKNKRNSRSNTIAIILIIISCAIIGGLGSLYWAAKKQVDEIDSNTFCRKDKPTAITVILIDHTDNINPTQKAALEVRLWSIAKSIPKNSQIKVYSVESTSRKVIDPEIMLCNPGSSEDVSNITGNKNLADKKYEEKFKKPIRNILDRVVNAGASKESPIMESLQSIVVTSFVSDDEGDTKKKLILVSDLLEHTEKFNLYTGAPDFETYKASAHWRYVKADLSDVDVEIFTLRRDGNNVVQDNKLLKFWMDFLVNQGAHISRTVPIEG
jgi:flagellar basal body-associated protein FliL